MTRVKAILGALALVVGIGVFGATANAQQTTTQDQGSKQGAEGQWKRGADGRQGRRAFGFGHDLNLSDAQRQQIEQIATRYRESTQGQREGMRSRSGLFSAFSDAPFDESAFRAAAQARANARVEREVSRARMLSEMYAVLTPEQKAQLAAKRQAWEQKRQEWRARRGAKSTTEQ